MDFQILAEADGSMPEEDDFLVEDKVYRWGNCPVLTGLALGDYAEQVLQEIFRAYELKMTFEQYALIGSTVRSYLTWLRENGRLEAYREDSMLLWKTV